MFSLTLCSCCSLYWGPVRIIRPETDLQPAGPIDAQVYTVVTRSGDGRKPIVKGGSGGGKRGPTVILCWLTANLKRDVTWAA